MHAIAARKVGLESPQRKVTRTGGEKGPAESRAAPLARLVIQRAPGCVCGGSCPRCREKALDFQRKLRVGRPGDLYEQEADRVADEVMRMAEPTVQLQTQGEEEEEVVQTKPLSVQPLPGIQRQVGAEEKEEELLQAKRDLGYCGPIIQRQVEAEEEEEEETVQTRVAGFPTPDLQRQIEEEEEESIQTKARLENTPRVFDSVRARVESLKGSGQPLPRSDRAFFELRMGYGLSQVRIHADSRAAETAHLLNARAFTVGSDVVFGRGQYAPGTNEGRKLLAHELTHTIQQRTTAPIAQEAMGRAGDRPRIPASGRHFARTDLDVQRQAENLRATRFSGNQILERAFDGTTRVGQGTNRTGTHVRLIQQSLLAQGYTLPVDGADGIFGAETEAAVRAFQVDTGAVTLDGIVGSETMRLLDMHDPGGTTGVPVAGAAPAANAATFSETATEQFAGYDASTAPDWLVVPVGGRRRADVAITPAGARPAFVSDTPGVATVDATRTGIAVTGISHGTARIRAREGAMVLDTIRVSVKNRLDRSVAFHYVCDSRPAAAGGPHCSNGTPSANAMRSLLNRIWHRQATVRFTGGASHNVVVPGNLGAAVDWTTGLPGGGEWGTVIATGTGANYNVFRVWRYMQDGVWPNDAANLGNNTLIGDAPCADGWGLPHECGHFLGLGHGSGFIMTPCGGRANQRVSKVMADIVNP